MSADKRAALETLRKTICAAAPRAEELLLSDKPLSASLVRKLVRARVAENAAGRWKGATRV